MIRAPISGSQTLRELSVGNFRNPHSRHLHASSPRCYKGPPLLHPPSPAVFPSDVHLLLLFSRSCSSSSLTSSAALSFSPRHCCHVSGRHVRHAHCRHVEGHARVLGPPRSVSWIPPLLFAFLTCVRARAAQTGLRQLPREHARQLRSRHPRRRRGHRERYFARVFPFPRCSP